MLYAFPGAQWGKYVNMNIGLSLLISIGGLHISFSVKDEHLSRNKHVDEILKESYSQFLKIIIHLSFQS
jgi:hypothetical protein